MNCPRCNAPGAYVGLNVVECSNERCEHFKAPERSPTLEPGGSMYDGYIEHLRRMYGDLISLDTRVSEVPRVADGHNYGTVQLRAPVRAVTVAKARMRWDVWFYHLRSTALQGYLETLEREEP